MGLERDADLTEPCLRIDDGSEQPHVPCERHLDPGEGYLRGLTDRQARQVLLRDLTHHLHLSVA